MKFVKLAAALVFTAFLAGCAAFETDTGTFAVQYATLKVIEESDDVSAEGVLEATDRVRDILETDGELTLATLSESFRERVDITSLAPSDQLLVNTLISGIESTIAERVGDVSGPFTISQKTTVLQLLAEVDEAASIVVE